ncbi:AEC family transporter [Pelagibacterium montanilacus]|uniref:AEC family transporter n=1 Tax=Pelagibacterium montanilacus TaxID=2185280 RepID=UPI000F8DC1CB|nr:AEC family transporter [Pelagibacterium montanilacus]
MLLEILGVVAPIFIIVSIGYVWARRKLPFDNETVGSVVLRVGIPCLIFSTMTGADVTPREVGWIVAAAICVIAISTLIGVVVLKLAHQPLNTYLISAMHGNSGNMGLPLAIMVFGQAGEPVAVAYFLVVALSQHVLGLMVTAGRFDARSLARQPIIHAAIVTIVVLSVGVDVPQWLTRTTDLLGGIVIPMMLLLLGVSLSQLKIGDLKIALGMSAMRFGAGATGALATIWIFGLTGVEAGVVWVMATMPAAVVHFLLAERYGRSPERVAGVIVVSTVLTLAGLPVIVWLAWQIAGI